MIRGVGVPNRTGPRELNSGLSDRLREKFQRIAFVESTGKVVPLLDGSPVDSLDLADDDVKHLADGKALIVEADVSGSKPLLLAPHFDDSGTNLEGVLAAELNSDFLWLLEGFDNLTSEPGVCILNSAGEPVHSTEPELFRLADFVKTETQSATSGAFEFNMLDETYVASYSQMFLKPTYKLSHWTVILFTARSDVLQPIEKFKKLFQWIILGTILVVVVVVSIAKIRKSMVPVGELIKGADRIARKDFSQGIRISSNDEFEVLARAFNQMAGKLDHNFKVLSARAEIDRAVLSTLDRNTIIKEALKRISDCVTCDACGLCLIDGTAPSGGHIFYKSNAGRQPILSKTTRIKDFLRKRFRWRVRSEISSRSQCPTRIWSPNSAT